MKGGVVPGLILGPMLRYVGETEATVWVETDSPCAVEVLGHHAHTFHVEGHHYALVCIEDLTPGEAYEYEVRLNGETRWPEAGAPPSVIRALSGEGPFRLAFGSCRVSAPHEPPYSLSGADDERGLGVDALYALAERLRREAPEDRPHALLMLGDQVYAHKPPFDTLEFMRSRREPARYSEGSVSDFEEYARLYRDSWGDPAVRWLFSCVPTVMIFDDHEVTDDWNISESWLEEARLSPAWDDLIIGGYASYWLYQHLGNLSPGELAADDLFRRVREADDAGPILRDFAYHTHRRPEGLRWSFCRDFGGTRLIVIDSRGGRILDLGRRSMIDDEEWGWVRSRATGDVDHLLLGTSLPFFLGPGMHYLQAASEAVCDGAWGEPASSRAEALRRSQDMEHWSSFHASFDALLARIQSISRGEHGRPPASIVILSGDVHYSCLAEAGFSEDPSTESLFYQAVCSPFRNSLGQSKKRLQKLSWTGPFEIAARLLARLAGVKKEKVSWRLTHRKPWFENHVASLEIEGRRATLTFEKSVSNNRGEPILEVTFTRQLA